MPAEKTTWSSRGTRTLVFGLSVALLTATLVSTGASLGGCRSGGKMAPVLPGNRRQPMAMPSPVKAVWVARFHYHYPDDVRAIIRNCAQLGFNTVLWQVRGQGTVAYASKIEPWSAEYGHRDPGFDPLQIAVEEAHRHGLRIEAWFNVLPGWKGTKPPPIKSQLWHTHPHWFLHDATGKRQPLGDFYVILNPCLPEVRRYITSLIDELVTNYDVDGVHLDYVRYAWETTANAHKLYPRDPVTLRLYGQQTGQQPDDDPQAWNHWRANQLTRLVSDIHATLERCRPGATLTAAVSPDPQRAYHAFLQNAVGWLRAGLIDAAMPMAYTPQLETFEGYIGAYQSLTPKARIIPGLGIYQHKTADQLGWQLDRCRTWGGDFALFSYDSLYATAGDRGKDGKPRITAEKRQLRAMRRSVVQRLSAE